MLIPVKIPMAYFIDLEQIFQKIYMEPKNTLNSHSNFRKKNKVGGITIPDIKLYCKIIVIKTVS